MRQIGTEQQWKSVCEHELIILVCMAIFYVLYCTPVLNVLAFIFVGLRVR